jgi:hypothetical protein
MGGGGGLLYFIYNKGVRVLSLAKAMHLHLVRKRASSIAESPPPITARGFLRKMGAAPSHTAQALMPLFQ